MKKQTLSFRSKSACKPIFIFLNRQHQAQALVCGNSPFFTSKLTLTIAIPLYIPETFLASCTTKRFAGSLTSTCTIPKLLLSSSGKNLYCTYSSVNFLSSTFQLVSNYISYWLNHVLHRNYTLFFS